ncbi:glycosyltransferase family protein [Methanobacterium arcticum]|nr:hypothetical protein [Methanobacterium arcticum]
MLNKKKICFLAPTAYSLLKGKASKNIIGPDVDQFTLAKELLNHGHKITFITFYEEGPKEEFVGQIRIIKTYKPNSQINIFSKMKCIWKALKKSDSDIYFHYGDSLGIISLFSYLMKKKSIYRIGSDALVNRNIINKKIAEFEKSKLSFKSIGNWLDIKLADIIILQNGYQYKELLKNYKKKG